MKSNGGNGAFVVGLGAGLQPLVLECSAGAFFEQGKLMVPSWARGLAPRVMESRYLRLPRGGRSGESGAGFEVARGEEAGMATAVIHNAAALSADELRLSVAEVFGLVLAGLRDTGFAHPVRMWNFVPGIHDPMGGVGGAGGAGDGVNRYHVFNMGRYDAFVRWYEGAAAFGRVLPAASAVGHGGENLVVCALGTRSPGVPVENPRQVPAFGYSRAHGPLPPCFARATVAELPGGTRLLVSGTASIRGEESLHAGSVGAQLDETFENLDRLVRSVGTNGGVNGDRFDLNGVETARVYFPRAVDRGLLLAGVSSRLPASAAVELFPAWVCRAELLVEIEATLAPLT